MYVNPFAFGVVATLAAMFILTVIRAVIHASDDDCEDIEVSKEEFQQALEEMTGKKFNVVYRNGFMVGEPIEDLDDDESDSKPD